MSAHSLEYAQNNKYGDEIGPFGYGFYSKEVSPEAPEQEKFDQVRKLAWSHGCTRPQAVIDQYGLVWTGHRYATVNSAFRHIVDTGHVFNSQLSLETSEQRRSEEPYGEHEPSAVTQSWKDAIPPMSHITGYAAPRMLLFQMEPFHHVHDISNDVANILLIRSLANSFSAVEFLAQFASALDREPRNRTDPRRLELLGHVLSAEVLAEENIRYDYQRLANMIDHYAPLLGDFYRDLKDYELKANGIAKPEDFNFSSRWQFPHQ